jgi:hypothetical protein
MLVVQMCLLIKVGIKNGNVNFHNLVYPVANLGAAKQLEHIDVEERPYVLSLIVKETGWTSSEQMPPKGVCAKRWRIALETSTTWFFRVSACSAIVLLLVAAW